MSDVLEARNFIVDFLRKELVGPSPGFPAIQLDGQEILRAQDPPRQRYGAGILFPMRSQVLRQDETGVDEEASQDADSPESDQIVEGSGAERDMEGTEVSLDETLPDTDRERYPRERTPPQCNGPFCSSGSTCMPASRRTSGNLPTKGASMGLKNR